MLFINVLMNSDGSLEKLLSELSIESRSLHSYQRLYETSKSFSQRLPVEVVEICGDTVDIGDHTKNLEFFDCWLLLRFDLSISTDAVTFYDSFRDNDGFKDSAFEAQPNLGRMRSLLSPSSYQKLLAQAGIRWFFDLFLIQIFHYSSWRHFRTIWSSRHNTQ